MTTAPPRTTTSLLRRAAVRATLAPSIHNTQPWQFVLRQRAMEIRADRSRRLQVLDPLARQLTISCGCALFNARVSLAAAGYRAAVERFPDPFDRDLLARLTLPDMPAWCDPIGELDHAVELRQSNRRAFGDEPVPTEVLHGLVADAAAEGAELLPVITSAARRTLARLARQAGRLEDADPAYRAELRAWTTCDPGRLDGVPAMAVPNALARVDDDLPIRDFDTFGAGALPSGMRSTMNECLLLLSTRGNDPASWLRAGEALERVLLGITSHGLTASLLTQVIEVARTNHQLRAELTGSLHPHVLLRVGRAPATPRVRRRLLIDMLADETDSAQV